MSFQPISNKQFYKFLKKAANTLNLQVNNELLDKIHTYFTNSGNIKNQPKWRIIRLMNQYGITSQDIFNDAINSFNEHYRIDENGNIHPSPAYREQLEGYERMQNMFEEAERDVTRNNFSNVVNQLNDVIVEEARVPVRERFHNVMNQLNDRAVEEARASVRNQFRNVANDIQAKAQQVRDVLNQSNKPIDGEAEQRYIEILSNRDNYIKGVDIWFRKDKDVSKRVRFSALKQHIIDFLNGIRDHSQWYFKFSIYHNGRDVWTTIPLNAEGIRRVINMLTQNLFDDTFKEQMNNRLMNEDKSEDNRIIECSDATVSHYGIQDFTVDMINRMTFTTKPYLYKESETRIYCDVGGSFYDKKLKSDLPFEITDLAIKYQIFPGVINSFTGEPRKEYEMNCLMYAFSMSRQFDLQTLDLMRRRCFTRYVSRKQLKKLCEQFSVKVHLRRWIGKKAVKEIINNIPSPKFEVKLCLLRKHYCLDEAVNCSKYYLKNYAAINEYCERNHLSIADWGKYVTKFRNGKYEIDNKNAHMSARSFIQYIDEYLTEPLTAEEIAIIENTCSCNGVVKSC